MPSVVVGIAQSTIAATGVLRAIRVATAPRDIDAALAMLMLMHCSSDFATQDLRHFID